jgi:hypothetical protein
MKKILQIKYCYTEQETNEFLKSLDLYKEGTSLEICDAQGYFKKYLSGITYFPRVQGEGDADKSSVSSDILAVVQYFTYTNADEK